MAHCFNFHQSYTFFAEPRLLDGLNAVDSTMTSDDRISRGVREMMTDYDFRGPAKYRDGAVIARSLRVNQSKMTLLRKYGGKQANLLVRDEWNATMDALSEFIGEWKAKGTRNEENWIFAVCGTPGIGKIKA